RRAPTPPLPSAATTMPTTTTTPTSTTATTATGTGPHEALPLNAAVRQLEHEVANLTMASPARDKTVRQELLAATHRLHDEVRAEQEALEQQVSSSWLPPSATTTTTTLPLPYLAPTTS